MNQNCDMILVQNGEGFVSENQYTIFCVERLNLSMKIAKPIQEKQSLLYSFLAKYTLKNGLFESSIQASNSCGGPPSNLT